MIWYKVKKVRLKIIPGDLVSPEISSRFGPQLLLSLGPAIMLTGRPTVNTVVLIWCNYFDRHPQTAAIVHTRL